MGKDFRWPLESIFTFCEVHFIYYTENLLIQIFPDNKCKRILKIALVLIGRVLQKST